MRSEAAIDIDAEMARHDADILLAAAAAAQFPQPIQGKSATDRPSLDIHNGRARALDHADDLMAEA